MGDRFPSEWVIDFTGMRNPPGAQLLWHGYTQLVAMAFAFELRDEFG